MKTSIKVQFFSRDGVKLGENSIPGKYKKELKKS